MNVIPITFASKVILLDNVPLDNSYVHTVHYSTATEQYNDFIKYKSNYEYDNMVPIRQGKTIRVPINENDVLTCNYIMFQNKDYSNKWFYAFITNTIYSNANMCEIEFQLDVMQTWMFDYEFMPSFIERQHTTTDNIGDNLIIDDLDLGDQIIEYKASVDELLDCNIMVLSTVGQDGVTEESGYFGRVFSGMDILNLGSDPKTFKTYLGALQGKYDSIVSVFMMPKVLIDELVNTDGGKDPKTLNYAIEKKRGSFDGYTPKNNKCYSYPYSYLQIYNGNGSSMELRYEQFSGDTCDFKLIGETTPNPSVQLIPLDYNRQEEGFMYALTLSGYPTCAWSSDTYKAWLAQNSSSIKVQEAQAKLNLLGSAISAVGAGFVASAMPAGQAMFGASALNQATNLASALTGIKALDARKEDIARLPPQAHGVPQSNIAFNNQKLTFHFYYRYCRSEFMKLCDDFWTLYGYPIQQLAMPNINARPNYTYLKTNGANIKGNIPYNDITMIRKIYDNGITTWKSLSSVGNYNLSNDV